MTDNNPLQSLLANNRAWAERIKAEDPAFFDKLSHQQAPEYLWIGCSDSRVPANQIVGLLPGEVFVHRNVANLVIHSDLNCLSVMQFAVDILKVRHIIVCGHYKCGGIDAAMNNKRVGLAENWLRVVQDDYLKRRAQLDVLEPSVRWDALCEMNAIDQVRNVALTTIVQDAWARGQELNVHGWIYGLHDGLIRPLIGPVTSLRSLEAQYGASIQDALARSNKT